MKAIIPHRGLTVTFKNASRLTSGTGCERVLTKLLRPVWRSTSGGFKLTQCRVNFIYVIEMSSDACNYFVTS